MGLHEPVYNTHPKNGLRALGGAIPYIERKLYDRTCKFMSKRNSCTMYNKHPLHLYIEKRRFEVRVIH